MTRFPVCVTAIALLGCAALHSTSPRENQKVASQAEPPPFAFKPVDEASLDLELRQFRDSLLAAIRARDAAAVLNVAVPSVRQRFEQGLLFPASHFGGQDHEDWLELERLLALGGTLTTTRGAVVGRREFCAPYVYSAFPAPLPREFQGDVEVWAILGDHIAVRTARSVTAPVLTYLSYSLVVADGWQGPDASGRKWAEIQFPGGRLGYVPEKDIRRHTDYHACFAKIDGRWMISEYDRDRW